MGSPCELPDRHSTFLPFPGPRVYNARDNGLVTVIGIFGATASGKSAVAEQRGGADPGRARLGGRDAGLCDLPILTNQSAYPARLVGIWPLDQEASVGEYAPLAQAAIDEILAVQPDAGGRWWHRSLSPGCARRARPAAGAGPGRPRALGGALRRGRGRGSPCAARRGRPGGRGARARERPAARGPRARARRGRGVARPVERPALGRGAEAPDRRRRPRRAEGGARRADRGRTRAMFDAGVQDEVRRALARPISTTARKTMGLDEVATLPRDEACRRARRAHAAIRGVSAQVDAAGARHRYGRRRPPCGRDRR